MNLEGIKSSSIVKQSRHILDLTQAELAKELGVSRQTVVSWEVGQYQVKKEYCQQLLKMILDHNELLILAQMAQM